MRVLYTRIVQFVQIRTILCILIASFLGVALWKLHILPQHFRRGARKKEPKRENIGVYLTKNRIKKYTINDASYTNVGKKPLSEQ